MNDDLKKIYEIADKHRIILYKEYISSDAEYTDVYLPIHKLKSVCDDKYIKNSLRVDLSTNKVLSARLYKDKYRLIDARPFPPKLYRKGLSNDLIKDALSINIKAISKITILTAFLNKEKSDDVFDEYINTVCEVMYDFRNYQIDREMLAELTIKGKKMNEKDIKFQEKRFKFINGFDKTSKEVKMKIVNQGLYWDESDEVHSKIRKAVHCLLETKEFIHSGTIAEKANVSTKEAKKYRPVFKDLIDAHNESNHDTKTYTEYINDINLKLIDSAIAELERKGKKITNVNIAEATGLHVNTVSNNRK